MPASEAGGRHRRSCLAWCVEAPDAGVRSDAPPLSTRRRRAGSADGAARWPAAQPSTAAHRHAIRPARGRAEPPGREVAEATCAPVCRAPAPSGEPARRCEAMGARTPAGFAAARWSSLRCRARPSAVGAARLPRAAPAPPTPQVVEQGPAAQARARAAEQVIGQAAARAGRRSRARPTRRARRDGRAARRDPARRSPRPSRPCRPRRPPGPRRRAASRAGRASPHSRPPSGS